MLVMEQLEPSEGTGAGYREALVTMVAKVCEQDGRTHSRAAIEQAIETVSTQLSLPVAVTPPRPWRVRQRQHWQALRARVKALPRPTWLMSPVARFLGKWVGISALVSAGLFFIPWGAVIQAPFATAIHHTGLFYALATFVLLSTILVANSKGLDDFSSETRDNIKATSGFIAVVTLVFGVLSSLGLIGAFSTQEGEQALNNIHLIAHDFDQVRTQPGGDKLDFKRAVLQVDNLLMQDRGTNLRQADIYDEKRGQVAFVASDLNQKECALVVDNMPDNFMVTHVNRVRLQADQPVVCPNLWHNDVQFANRPHTL